MKNILTFLANCYNNLLSANGSYEEGPAPVHSTAPQRQDKKFLIIRTSCFHGDGNEVQKRYFSPSQKEEMFTI